MHLQRTKAGGFPWIEHSAANTIVGVFACALGRALHLGLSGLLPGCIAGGLGLTWLVLGRDSEMRESAASPGAGEIDLWDAWLGESHSPEAGTSRTPWTLLELDGGIGDVPPRVRPRVYSSESGESLPLSDLIGSISATHDRGAFRVSGPDGSGKTMALNHLARPCGQQLGNLR